MKLWGVAMVRNEADVIEAFVRRDLTVLDGLTVVDHRSTDATPRVLEDPRRRGAAAGDRDRDRRGRVLPRRDDDRRRCRRVQVDRRGFRLRARRRRVRAGCRRSRTAGTRAGRVASRVQRRALRWQTFVPDSAAPAGDAVAVARGARRLETERHGAFKLVVARHFLDTPEAIIIHGNHSVFPRQGHAGGHDGAAGGDLGRGGRAGPAAEIRSRDQFVAKVAVKWLGRTAIEETPGYRTSRP